MERLPSVGVLLVVAACLQGAVHAVNVEVVPTESVVMAGQNVSMMCRVSVPIQYCRVEVPGLDAPLNLNPQRGPTPPSGAVYLGDGLEKGHCGVSIPRVEDKYNGVFKCSVGVATEAHESQGTMKVVVARAPKGPPRLDISRPRDPLQAYQDGESFLAVCTVPESRPVANISWFIGENEVTEGLTRPEEYENRQENLFAVRQNLTHVVRSQDHGKELRCVVSHPTIGNDPARTSARQRIAVTFGPQEPVPGVQEQFGFIEGEDGTVSVLVKANPKPSFTWTIDRDHTLIEGEGDPTSHFEVPHAVPKGFGEWETKLLIRPITKEDVEREYIVTATNPSGQKEYYVRISTSSQPRAIADMGAGAIVGIVIAVLLVLLIVFIVVFARATGRWCFAGGAASHRTGETGGDPEDPGKTEEAKRLTPKSRISTSVNSEQLLGQSSDTESADQGPAQKKNILKKKAKIPLTSMFKKAKDKVAGDTEILKPAVVTDEKEAEKAVQQAAQDADQAKECVYAELTHAQAAERGRGPVVVRPDDDKTEYAEIVHTKDEKKPDK